MRRGKEVIIVRIPYWAFAALTWLKGRFDMDRESGATAVEYGIMVALIAAVIITVVITLGTEVKNAFQSVVDKIP